jgi:hypothetical protein
LVGREVHDGLEGAKAAAQADYEQRIRSAITALPAPATAGEEVTVPRVTDNDRGEITATLGGKELRGWSYSSDDERHTKMLCAREFVEGFCTRRQP